MRTWDEYKSTMIEPPSLWQTAKAGDLQKTRLLLAAGLDINAKDHRGYSPLMLAAYAGQTEMVDLLLENGADANSADFGGNSILMGAAFKGSLDIVEKLIEAGADLSRKNAAGMDAFDFAVTFGRTNVSRYLQTRQNERPRRGRLANFALLILSRLNRPKRKLETFP